MRDSLAAWLRRLANRVSPARAGARAGFAAVGGHAMPGVNTSIEAGIRQAAREMRL